MHSYLASLLRLSLNVDVNASWASMLALDQQDRVTLISLSSSILSDSTLTFMKIAEWFDMFSPQWITPASSMKFNILGLTQKWSIVE